MPWLKKLKMAWFRLPLRKFFKNAYSKRRIG